MEYIGLDIKINVLPDKDRVLSAMDCVRGSELYAAVSAEFDALYEDVTDALDVRFTAAVRDERIYVLITAGERISSLSGQLFDAGEGLAGLIVNNCADDVLFAADEAVTERIKYYCASVGRGILKRLAAPESVPVSEQAVIARTAPVTGVGVTEAFMLSPAKSMGYELVLTQDESVFKAQHNCSECLNANCPRRSVSAKDFSIVSDFDYSVKTADGVAVDIGTTTVAVMRFKSGKLACAKSGLNAQRRFGADVLSRIDAAMRGRAGEMQAAIRYQIYDMIKAVDGVGLPTVVAGNTAMLSLYMGWDCTGLGSYPFEAVCLDTVTKDNYTVIGGISAFVGGDITSGLYMCGFDESEDVNLFIDLGTNGEMAIGNRERILCTSTAAGPAFEGGRISCGTGSVGGAVCNVDIKSNTVKTIANKPPCGICGTGIVELVSELLSCGYCDKTGRFIEKYSDGYKLAEGIRFTQKDMREFQTAKAAVRAGVELLIKKYGECDIANVYIAGGFGRRLDTAKACRVGLIPKRLAHKCRAVGNSSLGGAVKYLERGGYAGAARIKAAAKDFNLADIPEFNELFIKYMDFTEEV